MSDDVAICGICLRTDRNLKAVDMRLSKFHDEILVGDITMVFPEHKYCWECEYLLKKMYNFKEKCIKAACILSTRRKVKPQLRKTPHFLYKLLPPNPLGVWFAWNTKIYDIKCSEIGKDPFSDASVKSDSDVEFAPKLLTSENMPIGPVLKVKMESHDTVLKFDIAKPEFNSVSLMEAYTQSENPVLIENEIKDDKDAIDLKLHKQQALKVYMPKKSSSSGLIKPKKEHSLKKSLVKSMSKENIPLGLILNTDMQIIEETQQRQITKLDSSEFPVTVEMNIPKSVLTLNNMQADTVLNYKKVLAKTIEMSPISGISNTVTVTNNMQNSKHVFGSFTDDNCHTESTDVNSSVNISNFAIASNCDLIHIADNFISNDNIEEDITTLDNCHIKEPCSSSEKKTLTDLANISINEGTDVDDIGTINDGVGANYSLDEIDLNADYEKYIEFPEMPNNINVNDKSHKNDNENFKTPNSNTKQSEDFDSSFKATDNRKKRNYGDYVDIEKIRAGLVAVIETYGDFEIDKGIFVDKDFITTCVDEKLLEDIWQLLREKKGLITKSIADSKYKTVFDIKYLETEEEILEEFQKRRYYESYISAKHKCTVCYQTFTHAMLLKLHGKRHDDNGSNFTCTICKCKYENRKSLYYHYKNHKVVYKCKQCPLITYHRETMKNHFNRHNGVTHTCQTCKTSFKSVSAYNCHLSTVHGRRYSCTLCGDAFLAEDRLQWHMSRFHQDAGPAQGSVVSCNDCELTFSNAAARDKHASIQHAPKPVDCTSELPRENKTRVRKKRSSYQQSKYTSCRVCNVEGDYHFLVYHFKSEHPNADMNQLYADKKGYLCHICGKGFRAYAYLKDHINKHTGWRPYECGKCPSRFHGLNALKYHRLMHQPLGNSCTTCGKLFRSQPNLYSHMLTHNGDRKYKCKICSKGFLSRAALNEHIRGVHDHVRRVKKRRLSETESKVTVTEEEELEPYEITEEEVLGHYGINEDKVTRQYGITGEDTKTEHYGVSKEDTETEHYGITGEEEVTETGQYGITEEEEVYETGDYVTETDYYKYSDQEQLKADAEITEESYGVSGNEFNQFDGVTKSTEGVTDVGCYEVFDETDIYEEVIETEYWDEQKVTETWNYGVNGNQPVESDATYGITDNE